ncbi:hypothetical protein ABZX65_31980 [Streptomyces sp. NPDC003300]|uniref:hypothetical protein n=1 Tax=unclassified Streptomyces TaxID=2593676 RepID=UPI0033BA2C81
MTAMDTMQQVNPMKFRGSFTLHPNQRRAWQKSFGHLGSPVAVQRAPAAQDGALQRGIRDVLAHRVPFACNGSAEAEKVIPSRLP